MITGSKLQLAERCTHWLTLPADDTKGASADRGTWFHDQADRWFEGEYIAPELQWWADWFDATSDELPGMELYSEEAFALEPTGTCGLIAHGLGRIKGRDYSAAPQGALCLTADVVAWSANGAGSVVDHKTGRQLPYGPGESLQLGAAAVALSKVCRLHAVTVAYDYVDLDARIVTRQAATLDSLALAVMEQRIYDVMTRGADAQPKPGEHCSWYCPGHRHCAATHEAVNALVPVGRILDGITSPERLKAWLDLKPRVTRLMDTLDMEARSYVEASGGAVPLGDGREYAMQTRKRTSLDGKALEADHPELAKQYRRTTEYQQGVTRKAG